MTILTDFDRLLTQAVKSPEQMPIPLELAANVLGFSCLASAEAAVKTIEKSGWTWVKTLNIEQSDMILEDADVFLALSGLKALCLHPDARSGAHWIEQCAKIEARLSTEKILDILQNGTELEQGNARGLIVLALSESSTLQAQVKNLKSELAVRKDLIADFKKKNYSLNSQLKTAKAKIAKLEESKPLKPIASARRKV